VLVSIRDRVRLLRVVVVAATVAAIVLAMAAFPTQAQGTDVRIGDTGTLTFDAQLDVRYPYTSCPEGTPGGVECYARTGNGIIRGLGNVTESYTYEVESAPSGCADNFVRLLTTTARLSVLGKGEIELRISGTGCVARVAPQPLRAKAEFTITGGSGKYAGASGGGSYVDLSYGPPGFRGRDTWTGTLVVPGLDFDLTPPVFARARSRTVRAAGGGARARVAYSVAARDNVDGRLPVTCLPKSGSWFKVGRTVVNCSAIDKSGNTGRGRFTVTVRARG
jgi:HYR domain-containing protein